MKLSLTLVWNFVVQHWTFFSSKIKRNRTVNSAPDMKDKGQGSKSAILAQNTIGIIGMSDFTTNSVMPKCQNAYQPHFVG